MANDRKTIDRIVAGVLEQLGGPAATLQEPTSPQPGPTAVRLAQRVVTAAALESLGRGTVVHVEPRAILTPSAHDAVRLRDLQISRGITSSPAGAPAGGSREAVQVCVVQSTAALDRVLQESGVPVTRESCPDVAAETLANGIAREETHVGVVFAQAVHRAAMLANRNEAVRAAAVGDLQAAHEARRQVRANLWCLNADGRTDFELRNILRFLLHR